VIGQLAKKGKSYRTAAEYLMHGSRGVAQDRGHLITTNLTGATPREWAKEIAVYRQLRPSLGKAVFHASLSPADGDRDLSDAEWQVIASTYLDGMGFADCPFVAVLHRDTGRPHLHVLALRIKPDGSVVSDAKDYQRSETLMRQIERDWRLQAVASPRSKKKKEEDMPDNNEPSSLTDKQQAYLQSRLAAHAAEAETLLTGQPQPYVPSLESGDLLPEKRKREYKRQLLEAAYRKAVEDCFLDQVRYIRTTDSSLSIHTTDGGRLQDSGEKIAAFGMSDDAAAERLIEMAMLKGFESIVLRGSDAFLRKAMTIAFKKGLGVSPLDDHQMSIWLAVRNTGSGAPAAPAAVEIKRPIRRVGLDSLDGAGRFGRRLREQRSGGEDDSAPSPIRPDMPRRPR
jgi:hypothetical protein